MDPLIPIIGHHSLDSIEYLKLRITKRIASLGYTSFFADVGNIDCLTSLGPRKKKIPYALAIPQDMRKEIYNDLINCLKNTFPSIEIVETEAELAPSLLSQNAAYALTEGKDAPPIIIDAYKYIYLHLSNDELNVMNICEALTVSEASLEKAFKEWGYPGIWQAVIRIRVREAKVLLTDTNISIYEVAYEVGYHDIRAFDKRFKSIVGLSPSRYREDVRQKDYDIR